MEQIRLNTRNCIDAIPKGVKLVAVSKFHPADAIMAAYDEGQRIFGESRANEFVSKAKTLPSDIEWHFIGHLQTNKVRQILPFVSLIHSVDSTRLLETIDTEAKRIQRTIDILLQVHVAQEETKYGFTPQELLQLASSGAITQLSNINVRGVMGMATNTDDTTRIANDFISIKKTFDLVKSFTLGDCPQFDTISMGMSDDYQLAIEHGSNMVRIGSSIFGHRDYNK